MNKIRHFEPAGFLDQLAFFNQSTAHAEPPDAEICGRRIWEVCVVPLKSLKDTENNPHLLDIASRSPIYITKAYFP